MDLYGGQKVQGRGSFNLSHLRGKPLVLNFWAPLCAPCLVEMPAFQEVYDEFQSRVHLLGVDVGTIVGLGSPQDSSNVLRELNITYPVGSTSDANAVPGSQAFAMPTTLFITADGKLYRRWTGPLTKLQLERLTGELLAVSSGKIANPLSAANVRGIALNQAIPVSVCGDLNGDGIVDVVDAITSLQITVDIIEPDAAQRILGDPSQDGAIDVLDGITSLGHIVGLINIADCGLSLARTSPSNGEGQVAVACLHRVLG